MFKKLVAIEPVSLIPTAEEALHQYAEQVELYRDIPADDEEIVRRIGDADAALLPPGLAIFFPIYHALCEKANPAFFHNFFVIHACDISAQVCLLTLSAIIYQSNIHIFQLYPRGFVYCLIVSLRCVFLATAS